VAYNVHDKKSDKNTHFISLGKYHVSLRLKMTVVMIVLRSKKTELKTMNFVRETRTKISHDKLARNRTRSI